MAQTKPGLVGRAEEIERLRISAAQARSGQRTTLLVDGEAGVGKSRLISEAIARFREPGDLVIVGHGVELSGDEPPYGTVSETLASLVREAGVAAVRAAAREATGTLAALCPQLGGEKRVVDRLSLFTGYVALLERLAADRLVWLVVEDLHWADSSSRDLIRYVVRAAAPCRLLVVITVRTHDPSTDPGGSALATGWAASADVGRITIAPLTRAEVKEQVSGLTTTAASEVLVDRVAALSQGNPFLTEQLMAAGLTATGGVPASVLELMSARLDGLDPDARRLVQIAALAQGHIQHSLLERAYLRDPNSADAASFAAAVARAVETRVLVFDSTERNYTFAYPLLRHAVESAVRPVDRLGWHRMWADLLTAPDGQIADLRSLVAAAYHWEQAGAESEAFDASVTAARYADRLGGLDELTALLSRVLRLWDHVPDATRRAGRSRDAVLSDLILTTTHGKDLRELVALLDQELTRAEIIEADSLRVLCLRLLRSSVVQPWTGLDDQLLADAVGSIDALLSAEATPLLVHGMCELGGYLFDSDPKQSFRLHRAALSAAGRLGDNRLQRYAGNLVANQLGCRGRIDEALAEYDRLLHSSADSLTGLMEVECDRGRWLFYAGRYREAKSLLEATLARSSDPELAGEFGSLAALALCQALFALGEWDAEHAQLEELQRHPPSSPPVVVRLARTGGELAIGRGDTAGVDRWLETMWANLPLDDAGDWKWHVAAARFLVAQIAVNRGDLAAARRDLAPLWPGKGQERVPDMWRSLLLAAQVDAELATTARGQTEPDPDGIALLRAVADRLPAIGDLGHAWTAQFRAELGRALGRDNPADWAGVAEAWRTVGHIPYLAYSMMRLAGALLGAGDRDAAIGPLTEAFRITSDLGAESLRKRIIELANRGHLSLGVKNDSQVSTGSGQIGRLTSREIEVLRLVVQGLSNHEIAQKLFISPKTASVHVSRILTKLSVNSRAKAAAIVYEERLLAGPE